MSGLDIGCGLPSAGVIRPSSARWDCLANLELNSTNARIIARRITTDVIELLDLSPAVSLRTPHGKRRGYLDADFGLLTIESIAITSRKSKTAYCVPPLASMSSVLADYHLLCPVSDGNIAIGSGVTWLCSTRRPQRIRHEKTSRRKGRSSLVTCMSGSSVTKVTAFSAERLHRPQPPRGTRCRSSQARS
jgi:hypothetical protein